LHLGCISAHTHKGFSAEDYTHSPKEEGAHAHSQTHIIRVALMRNNILLIRTFTILLNKLEKMFDILITFQRNFENSNILLTEKC